MIASLYDPAKYDGTNASLTSAISPGGSPEIGVKYRIPPRCGVAVKLQAGQQLQIENTHGTQVCDFWAYLAADMGQFLSMSHCRTWLQSVFPKVGDRLVTNCRQPVLEIINDTSPGVHDTVMSCCDLTRYQLCWRHRPDHRHTVSINRQQSQWFIDRKTFKSIALMWFFKHHRTN